jgi:ABC-2 type transport system permease protein
MNLRLLRQTLRWNRARLLPIMVASFGWGMLIPTIYVSFAAAFKQVAGQVPFLKDLMNFGSGSLFTLPGSMTLGLQHPIAIAFVAIFAVGSTTGAIAGAREAGTLEVLLSRPISRHAVYLTTALATVILMALVLAALLGGEMAGVALQNLGAEVDLWQLPLVLANGLLLWSAFAAFGMAASVTFDRHAPAIGLTMAFLLINYFLEILGSLWKDVSWTQEYSLFHHFNAGEILTGKADPFDFAVLAVAVLLPVIYALIVFPRRDLAAPS